MDKEIWACPWGEPPEVPGSTWVAVIAHIRKNDTREVREYHPDMLIKDGEDWPDIWIWTDGNFSCDCNRALFFGYAAGETWKDANDAPCGEGGYSVKLVNPVTGECFFDDYDC